MDKIITALMALFSPTTLRSLLTLIGFLALSVAYMYGVFYVTDTAPRTEVYIPLVAMMVGYWFAERKNGGGNGTAGGGGSSSDSPSN